MKACMMLLFACLPITGLAASATDTRAMACVASFEPATLAAAYSVTFPSAATTGNVLNPNAPVSHVMLNTSGRHTAAISKDGRPTQTLVFDFNTAPGRDVCLRYNLATDVWSITPTAKDHCQSCASGRR